MKNEQQKNSDIPHADWCRCFTGGATVDMVEAQGPTLTPTEQLGKSIFFDTNLSINLNQSCAGCHGPQVGWTGPDEPINAHGAVYEGSSLALAIELTASQKVLLFAADAQVGNWLSWHKVSWPSMTADKAAEVTGSDLIKRTVLYKVGHHGSHNATLREKGVELMQSPELVAMIPVDEEQAHDKKWAMPFKPLLQRLTEKTQGRIIRSDQRLPEKPVGYSGPLCQDQKSTKIRTQVT